MECPTKAMSSYQRLKWEMEELYKDYKSEREKSKIHKQALWKIANLKGADVIQAPRMALEALTETNEKE